MICHYFVVASLAMCLRGVTTVLLSCHHNHHDLSSLCSCFFGHVSERCNNSTKAITANHDHHEPGGVQAKHSENKGDDDDDDDDDDGDDDVEWCATGDNDDKI